MKFVARLRHTFSHIPLLGPLFYARWPDHRSSFKELFISLAFSTVTFWGTAIFLLAIAASREQTYLELVYSTVSKGELFIFSVGLLGPILLATADDLEDDRPRFGRVWHIVALLVLGLMATGFHAQIKAAQFENRLPAMNLDFLFHASVAVAIAAICLRYLALLYRKSTFIPIRELSDPVDQFSSAFNARHGSGGDQ